MEQSKKGEDKMRGKRSEMPVQVVVLKKRGRPKKEEKGFMPPRPAPVAAPAIVPDAEEQIAAIVNDLQWQEADPALEQVRQADILDEEEAAIVDAAQAAMLEEEWATGSADGMEGESGATDEAQGQPDMSGILGNPETLAGDIRDQILNQIKRQQKPWGKMLNYEQAVLADQIYKISKESVAGALKIILNVPFAHVDVRIDKIAVDKEIKVALSAPLTGGALSKLGDALHLEACLILASAAEFQGQRQAPALDPDQPGLQLEETADHDHEAELI
jgi:hypothetical protein